MMCFSKSGKTDDVCQIVALDKRVIEQVPVYTYLGFFLEEKLSFKHHIECLTKKQKKHHIECLTKKLFPLV